MAHKTDYETHHTMKTPAVFFFHALLLSTALMLGACGTGTTGGGQPSGTGSNGGSGSFEEAERIAIQIEATEQMLASWDRSLFQLLTPTSAYALQGLEIRNDIDENNISLVYLDQNFNEIRSSVPEFEVERNLSDDRYTMKFAQLIEEQANLVIRVQLTRTQVLYAPLYSVGNISDPIVVNVGSHFVLKKLFEAIDTQAELEQLTECEDPNNCLNQVKAKAQVVRNAAELVQGYEITLNSGQNIDSALATLEAQKDLVTHIESLVKSITNTRSPIASGTPRAITLTDGNINTRLNYNVEHNATWLGFQLNDYRPAPVNNQNEVVLAVANSRIVPASGGEPLPSYPSVNVNTSLLDLRRDSLNMDIPFDRSTLRINPSTGLVFDDNDELNSFGFAGSDTFLSTEGFLLNDRLMLQTINDSGSVGWSFSPMFSPLYRANDFVPDTSTTNIDADQDREYDASPTWLMGANFSRGGRFDNDTPSSGFTRGDQQEALNLFSWEVHGQQTTEDFSTSDINGKDYGVVAYAIDLDGSGDTLSIYAETFEWQARGGDFLESDAETYTLSRANNGTVNTLARSTTISLLDRDFYSVRSFESTREEPDGAFFTRGLIGLDAGDGTRGHSSEDGRHLAFSTRDARRGRGLILATALRGLGAEPIFSGETYKLQGNSIGITSEENFAVHLNNAQLTINDRLPGDAAALDCNAVLDLGAIILRHDVTENTLNEPADWLPDDGASGGPFASSRCVLDGGRIEIDFSVFDRTLQLRGYVSTRDTASTADSVPGRVINMIWVHGDNLGLVFANQLQNLSPSFDD